jgi:hypothetical protein
MRYFVVRKFSSVYAKLNAVRDFRSVGIIAPQDSAGADPHGKEISGVVGFHPKSRG